MATPTAREEEGVGGFEVIHIVFRSRATKTMDKWNGGGRCVFFLSARRKRSRAGRCVVAACEAAGRARMTLPPARAGSCPAPPPPSLGPRAGPKATKRRGPWERYSLYHPGQVHFHLLSFTAFPAGRL